MKAAIYDRKTIAPNFKLDDLSRLILIYADAI